MAPAKAKKGLFVDANIFLSFYHFSNDDLDELQKLVDLIEKEEIILYATAQVVDEVKRNRDNKVQEGYKKFKEINFKVSFPQMCKGYPEYNSIRRAFGTAEHQRIELDKKLSMDISSRTLKADEVISELLALATIIESSQVMDTAHKRYLAGNPPGKNDSYGDAITWEALLQGFPSGEDLFFLSDDKDYRSPLKEEEFNSFLEEEWARTKDSRIHYYPRLSAFFNEHHKEIALRLEEEKKSLIEALRISGNFATTHTIVRRLNKISEFSDSEIAQLVEAALSNDQVYSIMTDSDLKRLFEEILKERSGILSAEAQLELTKRLHEDDIVPTKEELAKWDEF